jgi:predicted transcriptional regulator of viral defense system
MKQDYEATVNKLLEEQSILQYKELKQLGISSSQISILVSKGVLKKTGRGIYSSPLVIDDPYFELQKKYNSAIFSHESALSLHGLSDVTPSTFTVIVPRDYNYQYLIKKLGIKVKRVNNERYDLGIMSMMSPYGNIIRVYNKEKTICDIVSKRNNTETRILNDSLNAYFKSKDIDLNRLMKYAKKLNVDKTVRKYMEVLI